MQESFHNGETMLQIHVALSNICPTYEVIEIVEYNREKNIALSSLQQFERIQDVSKIKPSDVLQIHVTCIRKVIFLDVAVEVAPRVFAAYTIRGTDYSQYMVGRCIDRKEKITPQRAAQIFPELANTYTYEV